jgi:hypothetical protein
MNVLTSRSADVLPWSACISIVLAFCWTTAERKEQVERELKAYCALDTEAMMRVWEFFGGRKT